MRSTASIARANLPRSRPRVPTRAYVTKGSRGADASVLRVQPPKFLHALARVDLGRVDVALRVDGDVMHDVELARVAARAAYAPDDGVRRALDDAQLVVDAVDH